MGSLIDDASHPGHTVPKKLHALALPYPAQGHINPMMQLCKKLATKGFTITFVNTDYNHERLLNSQSGGSAAGRSTLPGIKMVGVPDGLPSDHPRTGKLAELTQATEKMGGVVGLLVEKIMAEEPPLSVIIADVAMLCSEEIANKFGIPRVLLRTSNASSHALYFHVPQLYAEGVLPFKSDELASSKKVIDFVPGLPNLLPSDFPSFFIGDAESNYFLQFTHRTRASANQATWILVNSFYELESRAVDALSKTPIFTVGPLLPSSLQEAGTGLWAEEEDCLQWLNTQKASSVLYISFGSIATIPSIQVEELAAGIEATQQPFLWVYRSDLVTDDQGISTGFLHRTEKWGRVVSWAPQLRVLSHPSVACFLSHCGWNSCMESIFMGVPILAWPNFAEQRLNARLVVDEWKVGIDFKVGATGVVDRVEVERVVRGAIFGEEGRQVRERLGELREEARGAIEEGGSSSRNIEMVIEDLIERAGKRETR